MCVKRHKPWTSSFIKPLVQYFLLPWSSPMFLSGRSLFSSKGGFNGKPYLLLAWLVYWSQTVLVQNIKATQSTVPQFWTPPEMNSS